MKRFLLILAMALLVQEHLRAQIVLNQAGYPASVIGTDSLRVTTPSSAFPDFTAAANGIWDLDVVTDSVPYHFAFYVPGITGYQFADSNTYYFGLFKYSGKVQSNIITADYNAYSKIIDRIGYSLTFLTMAPLDSFIILPQNSIYSSPLTRIAFPATYNSVWSSAYSSGLAFQLSFSMYGYDHTPGIIRTYTTTKDTVVGWGLMRVKDAGGSPSAYQHVLQVQSITYKTDCFFLGGVPFPAPILTMFSVTQGKKDTVYEQYYYRIGEVTPLAQVAFRDAAFSIPYKATTHFQRLIPDYIAPIEQKNNCRIYPNPASGNTVWVELPSKGFWHYALFDIAGNKVMEGQFENSQLKEEVRLPVTIPQGTYTMKLYSSNTEVAISTQFNICR